MIARNACGYADPIATKRVSDMLKTARRLERNAEGYRILERRGQVQRGTADAFVAKAAQLRREAATA